MRKLFCLVLSLIISFGACFIVQGESVDKKVFDETIAIGDIEKSSYSIMGINGYSCPLYTIYDELYVSLMDLKSLGGVQQNEGNSIRVTKQELVVTTNDEKDQIPFDETTAVYLNNQSIYVQNIRTYSLMANEYIFIPLQVLNVLWEMDEQEGNYILKPKVCEDVNYFKVEDGDIINTSPYTLRLSYSQIYWKDHTFIDQIYENQLIEPYGRIATEETHLSQQEQMVYLTTFIQDVYGIREGHSIEYYGQRPTLIYEAYLKGVRLRSLEGVFPKYKVIAKLKYNVGGFKEGEEVELWRSENRQYNVLKREDGKKIIVPIDSIDIIKDSGKGWQEATTEQIEDYVNLKNYESETPYLIWTDIYRQRTYVFKGSKTNWSLVKSMKCSTGKNKSLTPTGAFKSEYKVPYFGINRGFRCKNAVVIYRDYMYHSILFDTTGKYVRSGQYQLGSRVSHGCIRLSEPDSKWLYENIPEQTKVYIE